jgi:hypothetical protein
VDFVVADKTRGHQVQDKVIFAGDAGVRVIEQGHAHQHSQSLERINRKGNS